MVTLAAGQLVEQVSGEYAGRIWRIEGRSRVRTERWNIVIVSPTPRDSRQAGEVTTTTERWLHDNCVDYPHKVEAPIGDGPQRVRICRADGTVVTSERFDAATNAVAYITEQLQETANRDMYAEWFGWDAESGEADLTARIDAGELAWMES